MIAILNACGFPRVYSSVGNLEVRAVAFVNQRGEFAAKLFNLPIDLAE